MLEGIAEFREMMRKILEKLEISPPQPHVGALRAVLTAITFADIALEELGTKYMKGYGAVSRDASLGLDELVRDLRASMARLKHLASGETAEERFPNEGMLLSEKKDRLYWEES